MIEEARWRWSHLAEGRRVFGRLNGTAGLPYYLPSLRQHNGGFKPQLLRLLNFDRFFSLTQCGIPKWKPLGNVVLYGKHDLVDRVDSWAKVEDFGDRS